MHPIRLNITQLNAGSNFASVGLPLPRGAVDHCEKLSIQDHTDAPIPSVIKPTAYWPDGSVKWCLIKTFLKDQHAASTNVTIRLGEPTVSTPIVTSCETDEAIIISSGEKEFVFDKLENSVFPIVCEKGETTNLFQNAKPSFTKDDGTECSLTNVQISLAEHDDLSATCVVAGVYQISQNTRLNATFRFKVQPDAQLNLICQLHNPQRSIHPGGIWDLGDPGSITFRDFSLVLATDNHSQTKLRLKPDTDWISSDVPVTLFQASSGGARWDSEVHVNAQGDMQNKFRGYKFTSADAALETGDRSDPLINVETDSASYTVGIKNFWQNFPKSIDIDDSNIAIGLFPVHHGDHYELQGGERKTHEIFFNYNAIASTKGLMNSHPLARLDPEVYRAAGVFSYFDHQLNHEPYEALLHHSLHDSTGFVAKREILDEYGWRNFGDIYADHEADYQTNDQAFISHYNNQYDAVWGFAKQYALSGDTRWYQLMSEQAEHLKDIDIYRTNEDRVEYNNGMFWHTDHYVQACTATHRTYSSGQIDSEGNPPSGGGPGPEHSYASGLVYYYYMTGCEDARTTVLGLGDWIHNYIEGTGTLMEAAKKTLKEDSRSFISTCKGSKIFKFSYPMDRETGNYIRTLMDCFEVSTDAAYLQKVDRIIRNTAGPSDEIDARGFNDIEHTWFYIIFLQEVVRYLDLKRNLDQFDNSFYYARATLLHYARWMVANDQPYLSNPEILDHPNATWTAQEPRKVEVLFAAYKYSLKNRSPFLEKARFFRDYLIEELAKSDTLHYARIQILLLQNHGPAAFLDVDSLPYPGVRDVNITEDTRCFHTPGSHLKGIAGNWVTSIAKFRIRKEIDWIKARSSEL